MEDTIKGRLLTRFVAARTTLGPGWRGEVIKHFPEYDSKVGTEMMLGVANAVQDPRRAKVDRIEKVVLAMEQVVEAIEVPVQ